MTVTVHPGMKIDSRPNGGTARGETGTLGFLATYQGANVSDGPKYLITNAHVLASPSFNAKRDDEVICANTQTLIAHLKAWTQINTSDTLTSDIAIAELVNSNSYSSSVPLLGPITGISHHIGINTEVYTYGAETNAKKTSSVKARNAQDITRVQFTSDPKDLFGILGLISCAGYSQPGDSGSPLLNRWGRIIAMHVAGRESVNESMASPIKNVLQAASFELGQNLTVWCDINHEVDLRAADGVRRRGLKKAIDESDE